MQCQGTKTVVNVQEKGVCDSLISVEWMAYKNTIYILWVRDTSGFDNEDNQVFLHIGSGGGASAFAFGFGLALLVTTTTLMMIVSIVI